MFDLKYLHKITIDDVPLQWMTRTEFFSSDLEQFPLMYLHLLTDRTSSDILGDYNPDKKQRIFGCVLSAQWGDLKKNELCDVEIQFACNIPQMHCSEYDAQIADELKHRIGLADKVSFDDLSDICSNSPSSLPLLQKIWRDKIEIVYGKYIPHGRIFDQMYGIVRFSASGAAPRLGKTSEYRMLYWYMKDLGEKVTFGKEVDRFRFLEFYLLPTYDELIGETFIHFSKFKKFYLSTKKFWKLEYTDTFIVNGHKFKSSPTSNLPTAAKSFEKRYAKLFGSAGADYDNISQLRQIFNRMPMRLYGYIWNLMTPTETDFRFAFSNRDNFKEFYRDHSKKKGSSAKVVACFLQQAFGKEAFPIDTWVKTFIYYPLGMNAKNNGKMDPSELIQDKLYSNYNRLDKLEKLIWASSMGNKTNKTEFLDILWCQRYGTDEGSGGPCRGANPLSCSKCVLNHVCEGYQSIKDEDLCVSDDIPSLENDMKNSESFFGVYTKQGVPREIYTNDRKKFTLRDGHSGLELPMSTVVPNGSMTVDTFVRSL
ncbi:hypothetical protein N8861_03655 [Porticoccus sp.]|nr:hypothetical protein [Porticoccus sp.]